VNQLRLLKLEELRRRDFVDTTVRSSLHGVATSAGYFRENPSTMLNSIPTAVHHVDSGVALAQPKTLDEVVEESMPD
jgi:hypothetical protein